MPDDSKAQRLGRKRDHVEAGVWLTMHEECPWAQDARDVTHGHAVEDVQGGSCLVPELIVVAYPVCPHAVVWQVSLQGAAGRQCERVLELFLPESQPPQS